MTILVTGGAGYIGSHMVKLLRKRGRRVVVLDNLATGHRDAVKDAEFIEGDVGDTGKVAALLAGHSVKAVIHFAAYSLVAESVSNPKKYYANNVDATLRMLGAMREARVGRIVFSSTAAVYGEPQASPIEESHPREPINPYGECKLVIERTLDDLHAAHGLRSASLRYFNASGADPDGSLGERHDPETHLIPLVLQAASGRRPAVAVYGTDYPTRDGTCVRDYVHVSDLCDAHLLALEWLEGGGGREAFNLGSESGATVMEVIETARHETGAPIDARIEGRRPGDPAVLVASCEQARRVLGWSPKRSDLATIVQDAWRWERGRTANHAA
ncbi:MAG TPA: UDP-glucose 4-epimerase GalE [Burkholderiales bacterium]|nr:UDP-glucose 4-epimerase GalE [Burkholderiales bacterium]